MSSTLNNSLTELIVVGVYFCFLIAVGIVFSRLVKNSEDYFKAGGRANWWLVGASSFMCGISTYTFVGNASGIFKSGWSPLAIYLANVSAFVLSALFMAAWYRQMRATTVAEVIRERFGKKSEVVLATLMVINGLVWTGSVLYGLSIFFSIMIPDIPQFWVIIGVGVVVIGYCTVGGNWAVMANDFVQGLVMISVTVLITFLCFQHAGGVGAFFEAIAGSNAASDLAFVTPLKEGEGFMKAPYGVSWLIVTFMVQFFTTISLFQGVRNFSAKDGKEAAKASALAAGLMIIGCLCFFVPPIYGRLFLADEIMAMHPDPMKAPEYSFAVVSQTLLPNGAFSLMIVSMLAAAISSLDTGLNRNSALIIKDLLPALLKFLRMKPIPAEKEVLAGKIATVALGANIIVIALFYAQMRGVTLFDLMLNIGTMLMLPQFIPLVLFLFVRKVPKWAAMASMGAGFVPSLLNLVLGLGLSYQERSLAILVSSVGVYLISALFYKNVPEEQKTAIKEFYETVDRPVDFEAEVGQSSDVFQLKQIAYFSWILGGLIMLLLFLDNPLEGRLYILAIGGFIIITGFFMMWASKRYQAKEEDRASIDRTS